jgi:hypothetical protein
MSVEVMDPVQNIALLLQYGVFYGAVLGVFMGVAFVGLAYLNPEIWLPDYPPDIRERFGPMSEGAKKQRRLAGVPVFLLLVATLVFAAVRFARIAGGESTFFAVFLGVFVVLLVFNVVDLVILDWLIFVTIRPKIVVLPGTEGMAGYGDYGFHFRAFLKGVVGSAAASLVIAGIATLVVEALAT